MTQRCKRCGGLGYVPHRGEAMAADPCGCDDGVDEEQDPDDARDKQIEDERLRAEDEPFEWQEWRDYDPEC